MMNPRPETPGRGFFVKRRTDLDRNTADKNSSQKRFQTVLFDFDGTVYDTVEGITKSVQFALSLRGIHAETDDLRCFAGPPLVDKFMEIYHVSVEEAEQMVIDFRKRYVPIGIYESSPFRGMKELLARLRKENLQLGIATSKPQSMAEQLLKESGMREYFDAVAGSDRTINNEKKWQIIVRTMEMLQADPATTVLIGDTKYDAEGAARCGIPCIGVRWGYAAPGELEAAGVSAVADDMDDLFRLLTGS